MKDAPLIETIDLRTYFKVKGGTLHAVDGVNLSIMSGETLGVVGESGCGKSTLGRSILRLTEPTSGKILYRGEDITKKNGREMKLLHQKMNIIFQDPLSSLNPRMTVRELIADPIRVNHLYQHKSEIYPKVQHLMDMVGLSRRVEDSYAHELDGGRRQRIGIAKALALSPEFIVCDEPVSALDVSIQAQVLNLLMDLQDEMKLTYLFITHDLSVVRHISKNIMVMYMGCCIEYAPTDELFERPLHPYTKALLDAIPIPDMEHIGKEPNILHGEVASPINPPEACRFAPRCIHICERCHTACPSMKEVSPGHFVACTLATE